MAIYKVKSGDTLSSIAASHGFSSWQELYNDKSNAAFRNKRPNANVIFPGDKLNIPDASVAQAAGKSTSQAAEYRIAIIDGTGPGNDVEYEASMSNSFCRQLGNALEGKKMGKYWRGPSWHGGETKQYAQDAYEYLLKGASLNHRLMLAGYSRGGSAAILAAEKLEKKRTSWSILCSYSIRLRDLRVKEARLFLRTLCSVVTREGI